MLNDVIDQRNRYNLQQINIEKREKKMNVNKIKEMSEMGQIKQKKENERE